MSNSSTHISDHLVHEIPEPVIFNTWKHHAGWIRGRIHECASDGETALKELATQTVVLGHGLMDLYNGKLSPLGIAQDVLRALAGEKLLDPVKFESWVDENGGYRVVEAPTDGSAWVLRLGSVENRYVHVHPARYAPDTIRVRANVIKTAVLVNAYVVAFGGDPFDIKLVNDVRQTYLDLSPMAKLSASDGLQPMIELLGGHDEE
ncbi:MAG: hypothetical protein ACFCD0_28700 [Gemmataceae bacterium]